ncbi:hypothetical protein [Paraburkholderia piptadeniae]|uniref:hypothetical protein n=1 Tax=Paraburkholderia piptadeniae TaxID=1701573 RepID=UPI001F3FFC3F|nr:hypothetical protein [Paraburkholderia piptadeniae]
MKPPRAPDAIALKFTVPRPVTFLPLVQAAQRVKTAPPVSEPGCHIAGAESVPLIVSMVTPPAGTSGAV